MTKQQREERKEIAAVNTEWLRTKLAEHQMTQTELAHQAGLLDSSISRMLATDKFSKPNKSALYYFFKTKSQ